MPARKIAIYYAWSRAEEIHAPLTTTEDRFPALFESRRMLFPRYAELSDPSHHDQGIAGFLDHIMKQNFAQFVKLGQSLTGQPVTEIERGRDDGKEVPLSAASLEGADTLIIISFDSMRTAQQAHSEEIGFIQEFLANPDHLLFVGLHHDIGSETPGAEETMLNRQIADFLHHGDKTIPPRQSFSQFGRSVLAGLGLPVENRFGLRPAALPDGTPAPIVIESALDHLHLLANVPNFNLHAHLPQLERLGAAADKLDVLVQQKIDLAAPPHPFTANGRNMFDALLQSKPDLFPGTLLVGDTTLWSSTAGGVESLTMFWSNVIQRARRGG